MHTYLIVSVSVSCRAQGLFSHLIKNLKEMSEKPRKMSVIPPARPLFRHHRTLQKYYEISDGNRGINFRINCVSTFNISNEGPPQKIEISSQNFKKGTFVNT